MASIVPKVEVLEEDGDLVSEMEVVENNVKDEVKAEVQEAYVPVRISRVRKDGGKRDRTEQDRSRSPLRPNSGQSCSFDAGKCGGLSVEPKVAGRDPVQALGDTLFLRVLRCLAPNDLVTVGQVNKAWRNISRSPKVWRRVVLNMRGLRSNDPKLHRVLRAAPLLGRVAMRLGVEEPARSALLRTRAQVTEVFAAEMHHQDGRLVAALLRRWAPSLEVVHLDSPSLEMMLAVAQLPMPRLRQLVVEDEDDGDDEDRDIGKSQTKLLRQKTPYVSFEAGVPDKGRLSSLSCSSLNKVTTSIMLALVRAHRDTVQEVLFDLSDSYRYRLPAKSVMQELAACSNLTSVALDCNQRLDLLGMLPRLRALHLWLGKHHTQGRDGHTKCINCINNMPASVEHLQLTVWSGDERLVLQELLRVAPLLPQGLATLVLRWGSGKGAEIALQAGEALGPLLPGVRLHSVDMFSAESHALVVTMWRHCGLVTRSSKDDDSTAPFLSILRCPQSL